MAQYRGIVVGGRTEVSRVGHKKTGLVARANGWDIGIAAVLNWDGKQDVLTIYGTRGSNDPCLRRLLGVIHRNSKDELCFYPEVKKITKI